MIRKTFVELLVDANNGDNWRGAPSSRFRWLAVCIHRTDTPPTVVGSPRFYRTQKLAETFAKSTFRMYAVAKVKGFV